jgi:hypothetical protein
MELRWGTDIVRFELRPVSDGTELTLLDTLDGLGKGARDGAGWHTCLDALDAELRGDPAARDQLGKWEEVHPHYVERFGPAAASIGPPQALA